MSVARLRVSAIRFRVVRSSFRTASSIWDSRYLLEQGLAGQAGHYTAPEGVPASGSPGIMGARARLHPRTGGRPTESRAKGRTAARLLRKEGGRQVGASGPAPEGLPASGPAAPPRRREGPTDRSPQADASGLHLALRPAAGRSLSRVQLTIERPSGRTKHVARP